MEVTPAQPAAVASTDTVAATSTPATAAPAATAAPTVSTTTATTPSTSEPAAAAPPAAAAAPLAAAAAAASTDSAPAPSEVPATQAGEADTTPTPAPTPAAAMDATPATPAAAADPAAAAAIATSAAATLAAAPSTAADSAANATTPAAAAGDAQPGPDNGKRARTEGAADVSGNVTAGAPADATTPASAAGAAVPAAATAAASPTAGATTPAPAPAPGVGVTPGMVTPAFGQNTTTNQLQYIKNTLIKNLKKHKHAWPFKKPVDPVALRIPNYFDVIKTPMSIDVVEAGLKAKPPKYAKAEEAIKHLTLMFENCYSFNREKDDIYVMARSFHDYMLTQLLHLPKPEISVTVGQRSRSKASATSRSFAGVIGSNALPNGGLGASGRRPSMRSIRPAMKELPGEGLPLSGSVSTGPKKKKPKQGARMKYCGVLMRELMSKKHDKYAWPFYEPVNWEALGLNDYPNVVTRPMDLGTAKKKLEQFKYANADEFVSDIRSIFTNCYKYNGKDNEFVVMAKQLAEAFEFALTKMPDEPEPVPEPIIPEISRKDAKNAANAAANAAAATAALAHAATMGGGYGSGAMPLIPEPTGGNVGAYGSVAGGGGGSSSSSSSSSDSGSSDDDTETQDLLFQLQRIQSDITKIQKKKAKGKKKKKKKKKKKTKKTKKEKKPSKKAAGARKPAARKPATKRKPSAAKKVGSVTAAQKRKAEASDDSDEYDSSDHDEGHMTYEQKKTLSETINTLQDYQVEQVVSIISEMDHEALQKNDDGELEIDFQQLKAPTLRRLDKFVAECKKAKKPKKKKPKQTLSQQIEQRQRALESLEAQDEAPQAAGGGGASSSSSGSGSSSSSDDEAAAPQSAAAPAAYQATNPASVVAVAPIAVISTRQPPVAAIPTRQPPVVAAAQAPVAAAPVNRAAPTPVTKKVQPPPVKKPSGSKRATAEVHVPSNVDVLSGKGFSFGTAPVASTTEPEKVTSAAISAPSVKAPKILSAASPGVSEVKVANASAWLSVSAAVQPGSSVGSPVSSKGGNDDDFRKFQRMNEDKKAREKAAAERVEQQRKEAEAKRAAAEDRKVQQEREAKEAVERAKQQEEDKRANALAEAQRLREEAKAKREAMEGHVDIHEQSTLLEDFAEGDLLEP